jgi:hypothetical protein
VTQAGGTPKSERAVQLRRRGPRRANDCWRLRWPRVWRRSTNITTKQPRMDARARREVSSAALGKDTDLGRKMERGKGERPRRRNFGWVLQLPSFELLWAQRRKTRSHRAPSQSCASASSSFPS